MTEKPEPVTVYYDGSCPLCRSEIGLYQRGEGAERVTWCDISQPGAAPAELTQEAAMARFHVKGADGQMANGARAFILLWLSLPRWRGLGRIASLPPLPRRPPPTVNVATETKSGPSRNMSALARFAES